MEHSAAQTDAVDNAVSVEKTKPVPMDNVFTMTPVTGLVLPAVAKTIHSNTAAALKW